jgi:ABC-type amino acid transport substrate-binding protein
VRKGSKINDYVGLAGKKVGVAKGSTGMAMLKIVAPDAKAVPFDSYNEGIAALSDGSIDAVATDHIILVGLLAGKADKFKIVGRFGWEPYGLAVRQDDSKLRGRINEALQELWDAGEYQELYERWFGKHSRFATGVMFKITTLPQGNMK